MKAIKVSNRMKKEELIETIRILKGILEFLIFERVVDKHEETYKEIVEAIRKEVGIFFDPLSRFSDSSPLPHVYKVTKKELSNEKEKLDKAIDFLLSFPPRGIKK
jgi:hypothetical protein